MYIKEEYKQENVMPMKTTPKMSMNLCQVIKLFRNNIFVKK